MRSPQSGKVAFNKRIGVPVLALVWALSARASARSLEIPALVTPRATRPEPYRFFGERTVTVPLLVYRPQPKGLTLHAQLVQLTSNLAAPIGAPREVSLPTDASPRHGVEIEVSVPLPAVKRETDFELRFRSRRDRDGAWHAAGRIPLRVYPDDLLTPVRRWATSHPLRVKDDHGSLIEFLSQQRIPVVGVGRNHGFREGRGVTLYAGPRVLRERALVPRRQGEVIVLFAERETETPHLLVDRRGGGTVVTVEMRLLDRLATDPLAHKIFLEVFEVANEETVDRR